MREFAGSRETSRLLTSEDHVVADERERRLFAYAVSLGATRDDAADAVQEAFVRLTQALLDSDSPRSGDAWLFATVHHIVIDQARRRSALSRAVARLAGLRDSRAYADPPTSPADHVWAAVDALPVRQRAAIYLRYRGDLEYESIATVMGITESAARSYVAKALQRLQERLGPGGNDR